MKDDVIVLMTQDGEEMEFVEIAGIYLDNKFYSILKPVVLFEGIEDDEAFVFNVTKEGENDQFTIELDEEIIDRVFEEYYRLLDQEETQ